jgi:hypothetical protein
MAALFVVQLASAQETVRRCAATEVDQRLRLEDPNYAINRDRIQQFTQEWIANHPEGLRTVVTIPVVFHVVWNVSGDNISDSRLLEQLNVLNNDFRKLNADFSSARAAFQAVAADCEINFCLAQQDPNGNATTGIVRVQTTKTSFSDNDNVKKTAQGGDDAWDRDRYLNIWVCDLGSGLLGYAQFPGGSAITDGVVVDYATVGGPNDPGTMNDYDLGRTAVHEIGHWLDLYHIWGDDGSGCNGSDQVSDTPNQADETYGCPLPTIRTSCSNGADGDMYENYMDYTDDACMVMFTEGQKSRMQALFAPGGDREALLNSQGCEAPGGGGTCNVPTGLYSTNVTSTGATLNWGAALGAVSYNVEYKLSSSGTWTATTSTTNSKAISGLTPNASYDFRVQSACDGGVTSDFSTTANFNTPPASCSDILEPNNSKSAAKPINVGQDYQALIATSTDVDFYSFANTSGTPNIKVSMTTLPANYQLTLFNPSGTSVASSKKTGTQDELIKYNTAVIGTYKVKVNGANGAFDASNCYTLRVDLSATPWRSTELSGDPTAITLAPNPAQSNIDVNFFSSEENQVRINIYNMMGQLMHSVTMVAAEGSNTAHVDLSSFRNGFYLMEMINGEDVARTKFEVVK